MTGRLQIIWNKRLVGTLDRHKKGRVVFQYSQDWIEKEALPVSLSLPCRKEKFAPAVSTAFFENLLPESNTRTVLAFRHRFDKKDTYAFLENFGEDCAGALSIIPEDQEPDFTPGQYENITQAARKPKIVERRGRNLKRGGRIGWTETGKRSQFIIVPLIMAALARIIIGVVRCGFSSCAGWRGEKFIGDQSMMMVNRVAYAAVKIVAKKKIKMINMLAGLNRIISKIMSLE